MASHETLVALRVVSRSMRSKGKRQCFVCSDAGRVELRLLGRHRGPANRAFEKARRGDILLAPAHLGAGGDIRKTDTVTVITAEHKTRGDESGDSHG